MAEIDVQTNTILNTALVTENGSTKTLQQVLADLRAAAGQGGGGGSGDMTKSVYDPNNDGVIGIGQGGTGASTQATAQTALGVRPGVDVATYSHSHTLDGLSDVAAPAPTNGQILSFNGTTWTATTPPGGGNMSTVTYDATDNVAEQLVGKTAVQTVENKRLKDTAQIVNNLTTVGGGTSNIDLNNGNVINATMTGNQVFNINAGIQTAGNAQIAEFWLTGNYTPTFQVNGNAVTFVNGTPAVQAGGSTYLYAIKLNGSLNVVGFSASGSSGTGGSGDSAAALPSTVINPATGTFQYQTITSNPTYTFSGFSLTRPKVTVALTASGAARTPTFTGVTVWGAGSAPGPIADGNVAHYNFWSPDSGTTIYGHKISDGTSTSSSGYTTVQEEGASVTARATLNFIGPSVTAADNSGSARTDITITGTKPFAEPSIADSITLTLDAYNEITINQTAPNGHTVNIPVPVSNSTVNSTTLKVIQDGTGSRSVKTWQNVGGVGTLSWTGGAAPTLKTSAAAWDLISFITRKNSSGTVVTIGTWIGASS